LRTTGIDAPTIPVAMAQEEDWKSARGPGSSNAKPLNNPGCDLWGLGYAALRETLRFVHLVPLQTKEKQYLSIRVAKRIYLCAKVLHKRRQFCIFPAGESGYTELCIIVGLFIELEGAVTFGETGTGRVVSELTPLWCDRSAWSGETHQKNS
jgi:hypothetical protein